MWRNYLVTGLRSLAKNRLNTLINLGGLALGLAAFMTIMLFVRYETSYDAALPGAERAFQLQQSNIGNEDRGGPGTQMTSFMSGTALRKDFPQFDRVVYVGKAQPAILQNGEASTTKDFVYTDGPLFDVLQLPFLAGDRATALATPGDMVLTRSEALKRFNTVQAVGRTLTVVAGGKSTDYRVTGVVADPVHSHLALSIAARAVIFAGFSALAVVIGCLGLFGLAAFTTERRTKEIGIRKVLGARVRDIVRLLAWQFSKPVILANIVAWPVAWWAMRDWLNGFDIRIPLTPGPFVMAALLALIIAITTVAGHAIRVARLSPIHALRYE